MGCATGSPIFQGVGYPEKKPVYNSGCDGRSCGRLVLLFPLASQGPSLCDGGWKRWGSGWSRVDTREPADIPKLCLSHHTTLLSPEAAQTQQCPLCFNANCLQQSTELMYDNVQRLAAQCTMEGRQCTSLLTFTKALNLNALPPH